MEVLRLAVRHDIRLFEFAGMSESKGLGKLYCWTSAEPRDDEKHDTNETPSDEKEYELTTAQAVGVNILCYPLPIPFLQESTCGIVFCFSFLIFVSCWSIIGLSG